MKPPGRPLAASRSDSEPAPSRPSAQITYNVTRRFTEGLAGSVDEATAILIAQEEWAGYVRANAGLLGETLREKASLMGLGGIVEMRAHVQGGDEVVDMIEGKTFFRADNRQAGKHGRRP